jgi:hypothetical protein
VSDRVARRALEALVTLIAGLYLVSFPLNGTVTLTFALSVWLIAAGVLQILAATRTGGRPEGWAGAIGGVLSIVQGFLIADSLPSSAAWAIGLLVGINLMFWGVPECGQRDDRRAVRPARVHHDRPARDPQRKLGDVHDEIPVAIEQLCASRVEHLGSAAGAVTSVSRTAVIFQRTAG